MLVGIPTHVARFWSTNDWGGGPDMFLLFIVVVSRFFRSIFSEYDAILDQFEHWKFATKSA